MCPLFALWLSQSLVIYTTPFFKVFFFAVSLPLLLFGDKCEPKHILDVQAATILIFTASFFRNCKCSYDNAPMGCKYPLKITRSKI